MSLNQFLQESGTKFADTDQNMPALFIGHGSPMNAVEDNEFSRAWVEVGKALPRPNAILCISAHWETVGTQLTAMEHPKTIHDFYGFPRQLFEMQYPAPGSPELASLAQRSVKIIQVQLDQSWGLDHGAWSVLWHLFPKADIPVVQLSLDRTQEPDFHYALGKELRGLRKKGVLIIGSGNIVHNLAMAVFQDVRYDWAVDFDETIKQLIVSGDHDPIINYHSLGQAARLSIPTNEHYLPLLYILAQQESQDQIYFFAERVTYGTISMRSVCFQ